MRAAGVVDHQVHDQLHAAGVQVRDQAVEVLERPEQRVDVLVVADVVAVVVHRRAVDRAQPDHVDPEPLEVVEPLPDAAGCRRSRRRPSRRSCAGRPGRRRRTSTSRGASARARASCLLSVGLAAPPTSFPGSGCAPTPAVPPWGHEDRPGRRRRAGRARSRRADRQRAHGSIGAPARGRRRVAGAHRRAVGRSTTPTTPTTPTRGPGSRTTRRRPPSTRRSARSSRRSRSGPPASARPHRPTSRGDGPFDPEEACGPKPHPHDEATPTTAERARRARARTASTARASPPGPAGRSAGRPSRRVTPPTTRRRTAADRTGYRALVAEPGIDDGSGLLLRPARESDVGAVARDAARPRLRHVRRTGVRHARRRRRGLTERIEQSQTSWQERVPGC